jgi:hypothetical protein
MRKSRNCRPHLERLESMELLSTGLGAGLHHDAAIKIDAMPPTSMSHTIISLNGTLRGTYHVKRSLPDVGVIYDFFGHGSVKPGSGADVTGHANSLGNVAKGKAEGLLVISTPTGSLTLKIEGPRQKGFAPLPDRFSFEITNSSGSYLRDRGHGIAVLVLDPAKAGADHGTFTLVLVS